MATDKEALDSTSTPNLQVKDLNMFFDSLNETNEVNVSRSYSESNLNHDVLFSPDSTDQSTCVFPLRKAVSFSHLLVVPKHPSQQQPVKPKSSCKVLSSFENIKLLEEKKQLEIQQKEERKRLRDEKRKVALEEKEKRNQKKKTQTEGSDVSIVFTEAEEIRFQRRFENGYGLTHDKRYNLWLKLKKEGKYMSVVYAYMTLCACLGVTNECNLETETPLVKRGSNFTNCTMEGNLGVISADTKGKRGSNFTSITVKIYIV